MMKIFFFSHLSMVSRLQAITAPMVSHSLVFTARTQVLCQHGQVLLLQEVLVGQGPSKTAHIIEMELLAGSLSLTVSLSPDLCHHEVQVCLPVTILYLSCKIRYGMVQYHLTLFLIATYNIHVHIIIITSCIDRFNFVHITLCKSEFSALIRLSTGRLKMKRCLEQLGLYAYHHRRFPTAASTNNRLRSVAVCLANIPEIRHSGHLS